MGSDLRCSRAVERSELDFVDEGLIRNACEVSGSSWGYRTLKPLPEHSGRRNIEAVAPRNFGYIPQGSKPISP